ncbi:MAG: hypothetical protein HKO14_04450 [Silicimonas sp.]|nr:hypothetical protein [Silicimonas sp.]
MTLLHLAARHARLCLIAGLLAGLTLPGLAAALKPWLPQLVALLLFLSAVRIGPAATLGSLANARQSLGVVAAYQLALPLMALAGVLAFGLASHAMALVLVLVLAAPPVTGSPNFTALMGHDPAPPMRVLILGTALFPLTVLPVLAGLHTLGDATDVLTAAARLIGVISLAVLAGFAVHRIVGPATRPDRLRAIDGASAIALGVVVVGLMSALGPALRTEPANVALWLGFAVAVNFGLQVLAWRATGEVGYAIQAGNRNIALFLVALPPVVTDPILIFIGCYQIPMYLTPMIMARLYRRATV